MEYFRVRPDYPPGLLGDVPHTHKPVDDARGHAAFARGRRRASDRFGYDPVGAPECLDEDG